MDRMQLKALAKINLGLDVLRRREDGYHEGRMIMQTVHIFDQLQLEKKQDTGISVRTNLYYLPENENNLVYKAAKLLWDEFGLPGGISIQLKKYIPVAAGMAGGSSDAAAVLFGMNRMYDLGLSMEELMQRGVKIGADVPYCIMRGTALAEGIGEVLSPLPPMPPCTILVAKPGIGVSTRFVFENLKAKGGVKAMEEVNNYKAQLLYDFIDNSKLYKNNVERPYRSVMNVPFVTGSEELDAKFIAEAKKAGLVSLKGHRIVGGMRASIYNAMPVDGVKALIEFMKKFESENA